MNSQPHVTSCTLPTKLILAEDVLPHVHNNGYMKPFSHPYATLREFFQKVNVYFSGQIMLAMNL